MLAVTLIAVGRLKKSYLRDGIADYLKRLGSYCRVEVKEVAAEPDGKSGKDREMERAKEGERILSQIPPDSYTIALDMEGESLSSPLLAAKVERLMVEGTSRLVFIIGGSNGLDQTVKNRVKMLLSLSRCTFPHQLARLIILEQLYRVFTIIKNENYHK